MKNKRFLNLLWCFALTMLAVLTGGASGVLMAATALDDGGYTADDTEAGTGDGAALTHTQDGSTGLYQGSDVDPRGIGSITAGEAVAAELYEAEIEKRVTKIRPMATPLVQIASYARKIKTDSMTVRYWSVGTRDIDTTTSEAYSVISGSTNNGSVILPVTNSSMFDVDDTIRVVGVKGYVNGVQGTDDLVLCVTGIAQNGNPYVFAVNGLPISSGSSVYTKVPSIPSGTKLVRMGKACAELDAQTASFANYPEAEIQYCQNYMTQVEQSTFDRIAEKEANWTFSDMEEDSLYDFKMGKEASSLFGVKAKMKHPIKKNNVWFTGGIWNMAGKDVSVGRWDKEKNAIVIHDDEFVDLTKQLFTGVDSGNRRKIVLAGSDVIAAFSKATSDKFMVKEPRKFWDMEFDGLKTNFGELDFIHNEFFDLMGMSDHAFIMDPDMLTKATYVAMGRNVIDLKKIGVRNSEAVVMQEVSCLYLRLKKAHARLVLNSKPAVTISYVLASGKLTGIEADSTATTVVNVDSEYAWVATKASADTWYDINVIGDKLYITPSVNTASGATVRTGTITLTSAEDSTVTKTISLSQAAPAAVSQG